MGRVDNEPHQEGKEEPDTGKELDYGPGKLIAKKRRADMHESFAKNEELDWNAWIDVRIPTWLAINQAIGVTAKFVFAVILSFYKQGLPAHMSQDTLAAMVDRKSPKTVRGALQELANWKLTGPGGPKDRPEQSQNQSVPRRRTPVVGATGNAGRQWRSPQGSPAIRASRGQQRRNSSPGRSPGKLAEYLVDQIVKNNPFEQVNSTPIEEVIFTLSKGCLPTNIINTIEETEEGVLD